MQATRQRILDYIEQRGNASARQLAQAFSMTTANLRRHLAILEKRGLVAPASQRPAEGRGRPEQVYALTARAQNDNMAGIAHAALAALSAGEPRRNEVQRARRLASALIGELEEKAAGQITQRLVAAVQRLKPLGYRPRWEARPDGPQVVLGHCPYAAIIADHPELCQMDAHILEDLLGSPAEQMTKLQMGPQGTPQCIFVLQQSIR